MWGCERREGFAAREPISVKALFYRKKNIYSRFSIAVLDPKKNNNWRLYHLAFSFYNIQCFVNYSGYN